MKNTIPIRVKNMKGQLVEVRHYGIFSCDLDREIQNAVDKAETELEVVGLKLTSWIIRDDGSVDAYTLRI